MKITIETIVQDLELLKEKFSIGFIIKLCAVIIYEYCWWNWDTMKNGIISDPDLNELLKKEIKNGRQ